MLIPPPFTDAFLAVGLTSAKTPILLYQLITALFSLPKKSEKRQIGHSSSESLLICFLILIIHWLNSDRLTTQGRISGISHISCISNVLIRHYKRYHSVKHRNATVTA
ncbi:hypothetical protein K503DRAFT_461824 [Rhizopogon vinicolor AM-OR11-026]|uniref:Uncharacterized protein n=1 Tax=Rhizopogon vinicolor AM-OR11-026 TaxID=1314800 RepID=A0A1B7MNP3_9AGAM|nr:hypothetical protein K503DRAFT_461824 [Rhizopogon vinicolor AM-OR11-026]